MKKIIRLILSFVLFAVLTVLTLVYLNNSKTKAPFGEDYTVLRIFDSDGFNSSEISAIRYAADEMSETVEGAQRLWCDTYSRFEEVSVKSDNGKSTLSPAVVTGGDYFLFHNLDFVNGWYYSDTDINFDRVVIDERLSFQLFGSNNSEGMRIFISDMPFYVAGVVKLDESDAYTAQFEDKPIIYIPENIGEKIFGNKDFDYYEICLQNPVDSHAVNALAGVTENMTVVDLSARFNLKNTYNNLKTFTQRSFLIESESLPFWENFDRQREDTLVLIVTFTLISFVIFVIELIVFIVERKKR